MEGDAAWRMSDYENLRHRPCGSSGFALCLIMRDGGVRAEIPRTGTGSTVPALGEVLCTIHVVPEAHLA